ncbi:extracellular solute-binding protein, partial [bacterium M00.F.Ca.ET.194.01.1.1]
NRAFLAGEVSVIANGISAYNTAKINKDKDPKLDEIAKDIRTTNLPIGPVGKSVELFQVTTAVIFNYTPYPNAAKAYLQFMFEDPQMSDWITSSAGYCCQTL